LLFKLTTVLPLLSAVTLVDGIIIGMILLKLFMKTILIFAAVAGVAIVAAYYLLVEDLLIEGNVEQDDISLS